jgi:hypothetical protein
MICCYCDYPLTSENITLDHIVPDSKRGTFNTTNLTVACLKCNSDRGNRNFFDYCKKFNFSKEKLDKYKSLYSCNLKIKVLNIAKEKCLVADFDVPIRLIANSCKILKINIIDFYKLEKRYAFDIRLGELSDRNSIKHFFETLIRIIEAEALEREKL